MNVLKFELFVPIDIREEIQTNVSPIKLKKKKQINIYLFITMLLKGKFHQSHLLIITLVYEVFVIKFVRLNLFNHMLALFHAKFACNSVKRYPVFRWESCKGCV